MKKHEYNGVSFEVPTLTKGFYFEVNKSTFPWESGISTYVSRWDVEKFNKPSSPRMIDTARNDAIIQHRILDCPIRFPGSNVRLPTELLPIMPEIVTVLDYEAAHNKYFDEYYAYITTDYSFVKAGGTQRKAGCHVDGYQGARTTKNERINRSYVYSSGDTTEFFLQRFPISHINDSRYNVFHYFDKIADEAFIWRPKEWEIVLMNVYNVHRAPIAKEDGYRFFFRLSFDTRKFDRLGNTHNPMFNYEWDMVARNTQKDLLDY